MAIESSCYKVFVDYVCTKIIPRHGEYKHKFDIAIGESGLSIHYKKNIYYVTIIYENGNYYWKLEPYKNSFYTCFVKNENSFDMVLYAIEEHDKLYQTKRQEN